MPESLRSKLARWSFNVFPAYRSTGAWITYIAADWREVRVRLELADAELRGHDLRTHSSS